MENSYTRLDLKPGSDEWRAFRKTKIGASDAPIIMNASPYCTPRLLWNRKLGLEPEADINDDMRRGIELEPIALAMFNKEMKLNLKPAILQDVKRPYMIASLDGFSEDGKIAVEIKAPKMEMAFIYGGMPELYYPQFQHQFHVSRCEVLYYVRIWNGKVNFMEITKNDLYCDKLLGEIDKFWYHLSSFEEPELSEMDFESRSDLEWQIASRDWYESNTLLKEAMKHEEAARKKLIDLSNGKNCRGSGLRLLKYTKQGSIQYEKIDALKNVNLNEYRKPPIQCWRLSSDKPK